MVRINIISPKCLADQHLLAEYNEILMLFGYVKKYPALDGSEPQLYTLGKGHIKFFKDKLLYLKNRHEKICVEMARRGYYPTKTIDLSIYPKELINDWFPFITDYDIIRDRICEKLQYKFITEQNPHFYTYERQHHDLQFFIELLNREE